MTSNTPLVAFSVALTAGIRIPRAGLAYGRGSDQIVTIAKRRIHTRSTKCQ